MRFVQFLFFRHALEGKTPFDKVDFKPFVPIFDILKKIYLDNNI